MARSQRWLPTSWGPPWQRPESVSSCISRRVRRLEMSFSNRVILHVPVNNLWKFDVNILKTNCFMTFLVKMETGSKYRLHPVDVIGGWLMLSFDHSNIGRFLLHSALECRKWATSRRPIISRTSPVSFGNQEGHYIQPLKNKQMVKNWCFLARAFWKWQAEIISRVVSTLVVFPRQSPFLAKYLGRSHKNFKGPLKIRPYHFQIIG